MTESRTVRDPFLGKDVEISNRLVDRLRGRYANGPTMPNGEPEFGWREFPTPPIQHEAAAEIERLRAELQRVASGSTRRDTTVVRVYFHAFSGAFAVTEDGKEWRLSIDEIKNALNAQPLIVSRAAGPTS